MSGNLYSPPPFPSEKFMMPIYVRICNIEISNIWTFSERISAFHIPDRSPICVMIKTYLYTPRAVRSIDKRQESNKVLLWSIWSTRRREYLQRQSPRLSTLRGNLAYNSSQLRQQLLIVTRVWNFNAKTFERAIRSEADPHSGHSSCIHLNISFYRYFSIFLVIIWILNFKWKNIKINIVLSKDWKILYYRRII